MKHYIPFGFAILVALAASSPVASANTIYQIAFESFDFSSATGGPYYLDFQLTGTGSATSGLPASTSEEDRPLQGPRLRLTTPPAISPRASR